jgi:hypothetical protein
MSWHPSDLVSDVDLRDYEAAILQSFGETSWLGKRTKALEDWLFPILKSNGFDPHKLRTRYECDKVWGYTGSSYSDKTSAASDTTDDDLNLATIFATAGTDALYVGSTQPFRGLFFRVLDSVSSTASVLSVAYWNGNWESLTVADGTAQTAGKTFSAGGTVSWLLPMDWATRKVNGSSALYWVKVTVSATPTGATASQIGVVRAVSLRAPATFRTLELIFREAPTGADGPWSEKADYYARQADQALQRALLICGGDFETDDPGTDLISPTEAAQTPETAGGGWKLERA